MAGWHEGDAEIFGHLRWFLGQLVRGDAEDAVARRHELSIAFAIGAEGSLGAVGLEAVELADETGIGPKAIDLETLVSYG